MLEDIIDSGETATMKKKMIRENLELNRDIMLYKQNIDNLGVAVTDLYKKERVDKLDCNFFLLKIYKSEHRAKLIKNVRRTYNNDQLKPKLR